jgi:hypothetical protein
MMMAHSTLAMKGDGDPTKPVREGPPGRRIDGSTFGGSGGNGASSLFEDHLLGRGNAKGCVD